MSRFTSRQPVTLQGVSDGMGARAIIAPPTYGVLANNGNPTFYFYGSQPYGVQLWVDNVACGPVNITNLTVEGYEAYTEPSEFPTVGIFYQNSSGTVNRVAVRNQTNLTGNSINPVLGLGILAEGGFSNPLVIIENSIVENSLGIVADTGSGSADPAELTAVIAGNYLASRGVSAGGCSALGVCTTVTNAGIWIAGGSNATVTNNVTSSIEWDFNGAGSISGNTVLGGVHDCSLCNDDGSRGWGIDVSGTSPGPAQAEVSVTSNKIMNGSNGGIFLGPLAAAVQGNSITNSGAGIEFGCNFNPNVHSNIIMDTGVALNHVPSAITSSNTYFNVGTIRTGC